MQPGIIGGGGTELHVSVGEEVKRGSLQVSPANPHPGSRQWTTQGKVPDTSAGEGVI